MSELSRALFLCEGSSDNALGNLVARLLLQRGCQIQMTIPDFERLGSKVSKDLTSKLEAALTLMGGVRPDLVVMHRDKDNAELDQRASEMSHAMAANNLDATLLAVIPVRMTEAWLLLDESLIRSAAGNPAGRMSLNLPGHNEVERRSDPKAILRDALLIASGERGRRRDRAARQFAAQRRQLLDRLDVSGPVNKLGAWQHLVDQVDAAAAALSSR